MPLPITHLQSLPAGFRDQMIQDRATGLTFSQFGEDSVIFHLLVHHVKKIGGGFYVDVGAFHPRLFSNTKILTLLGWTGINIDANADAIAAFRTERPNDINICCGVAAEPGELTYHRFEGAAMNTFSAETAEKWQRENGWKLIGKETVQVRRLDAILAESLPPNQTIDYMNIDVEGMDASVVASIDFTKYKPTLLSVELFGVDKMALRDSPTVQRLRAHGYKLVAILLSTFIFIDQQFYPIAE
jgi:FkbM family methyltransferase